MSTLNQDWTLTYTPGANGTIGGISSQTVNYNAGGSAVTAVPDTGYHFVQWSDGVAANPRTDTNVTTHVTVTASFAINQYRVVFQTDGTAGATLIGVTPQLVNYGADCTTVTASLPAGHHFTGWTAPGADLGTSNPLVLRNITASTTVTAHCAINRYTLTYAAGTRGSINGMTSQTLNYGATGTPVEAVPYNGFKFVRWSDGSTANPRTDANVTGDLSVTAQFAASTSATHWRRYN